MAVFRVEKNMNYTVMSNHHLKNPSLSLKAKGLLSLMLSLPENWNYTLKGLSLINRESIDAIRTAVWELEKAGYIVRRQGRDEKGKMTSIEYTVYEQPQVDLPVLDYPILENPTSGKPVLDYPTPDKPTSENPMQLNKEVLSINLISKNRSINQAALVQQTMQAAFAEIDKIDAMDVYRELIKENIDYDILCQEFKQKRMDEILELILETVCTKKKTIRIAGEDFPADIVKSRFIKLDSSHIQYIFECIDNNTSKIHNIKNYVLTALYNAPATMEHYYQAEVTHDLYGDETS